MIEGKAIIGTIIMMAFSYYKKLNDLYCAIKNGCQSKYGLCNGESNDSEKESSPKDK
ncbi:hypothetical protein PIROE2DRAFT_19111 [Piromyces sp. E2]|nr:hypothetical protein PIROE2DRAFT_19111 [Piromyces sp. E2]|eukprot:OUM56325.1 hypothetical protein PIROE2DRAFT_19111 [Piromyces sp. E2]